MTSRLFQEDAVLRIYLPRHSDRIPCTVCRSGFTIRLPIKVSIHRNDITVCQGIQLSGSIAGRLQNQVGSRQHSRTGDIQRTGSSNTYFRHGHIGSKRTCRIHVQTGNLLYFILSRIGHILRSRCDSRRPPNKDIRVAIICWLGRSAVSSCIIRRSSILRHTSGLQLFAIPVHETNSERTGHILGEQFIYFIFRNSS